MFQLTPDERKPEPVLEKGMGFLVYARRNEGCISINS